MKVVFGAIILGACTLFAHARVYTRCELAQDMLNYDLFHDQVNDWVCLVEHESSRDSNAIQGPNTDGSFDYGLFQINDRYWCGAGGPGGDCNIACKSLQVDDGVGAAANCVSLIYSRMGLDAWYGWQKGCKGQSIPDVHSECGFKAQNATVAKSTKNNTSGVHSNGRFDSHKH